MTDTEPVELSPADIESLERSAMTIVEGTSQDQRRVILTAMEQTYVELARKYEGHRDGSGRAWAAAMGQTLRRLVADIERRQTEG